MYPYFAVRYPTLFDYSLSAFTSVAVANMTRCCEPDSLHACSLGLLSLYLGYIWWVKAFLFFIHAARRDRLRCCVSGAASDAALLLGSADRIVTLLVNSDPLARPLNSPVNTRTDGR